jgi:paraquat-inducible protein A
MARVPSGKVSLMERHPRNVFVPLALLVVTAVFLLALSLPLMHAKQQFLWKRWESAYSAWSGVVALWEQNELALAAVLFIFCIVFPLVKLTALAVIWFVRLADEDREKLLHWLEVLGKWSMLDVFVVAILIVLVKLGPLAQVEPRAGVYVFVAAILLSMLLTVYVTLLARQSHRVTKESTPRLSIFSDSYPDSHRCRQQGVGRPSESGADAEPIAAGAPALVLSFDMTGCCAP